VAAIIDLGLGPADPSASSALYYDTSIGSWVAKLLPGAYLASSREMVIATVLGSCVAACLYDRTSGVFGMNHFMLPRGNGEASKSMRYGAYAMEVLLNEMFKLGARRDRLEAKVTGGGAVLPAMKLLNVGERNAAFVVDYLNTEGIPIRGTDLEGPYARKIYLYGATGRVRVRQLRTLKNDTVPRRDEEYLALLQNAQVAGEVSLFE
jgi:chemotaxis protein CheD